MPLMSLQGRLKQRNQIVEYYKKKGHLHKVTFIAKTLLLVAENDNSQTLYSFLRFGESREHSSGSDRGTLRHQSRPRCKGKSFWWIRLMTTND